MTHPEYEPQHPTHKTQLIGWGPALLLSLVALIVVGLIYGPDLQRRFVENSREHIEEKLRLEADARKELARAEAERAYRLKEAEMKAEAEAMAKRLQERQIAPSTFRDVYRKVAPSIVRITADSGNPAAARSDGSGIIIRVDRDNHRCHVITNSHVVHVQDQFRAPRLVSRATITLASGRTIEIVPSDIHPDPLSDLALLTFDCSEIPDLVAAEFALDEPPEQGDWAIAIGHPFGLTQTMTVGIVSAVGRMDVPLGTLDAMDLVQTDAAINPGNSGGPLLDVRGRVIGVNTVIVSGNGANQGVGFAIPAKTVMDVFQQLSVPPYTVTRGFLGVEMVPLDKSEALKLGKQGGVRVIRIAPRTPADQAGLRPNDIIVSYDGKEVLGIGYLRRFVMDTAPDATVEIGIIRIDEGKPVEMTVKAQVAKRFH